mgnify:CR=1 FL=1
MSVTVFYDRNGLCESIEVKLSLSNRLEVEHICFTDENEMWLIYNSLVAKRSHIVYGNNFLFLWNKYKIF